MILNELKLTAKENGCNIKQYDIWKKTGIALCENGNTLVFYRKTNDNIEYRNAVLLNEFSQCKPQKVMHTEDAYTEIESLALELSSNQLKKSTLLEFFNTNKDTSTLGNEVLILHKWESLVTERLAKK